VPESVIDLLRYTRGGMEFFDRIQNKLVKQLQRHPLIVERVQRLMTIPGVGAITALTWALEVGQPQRFSSLSRAISYCGLCGALKQSAGKTVRTPISKQRNKYLQWSLIEAAKLAPRHNMQLAWVRSREIERGNKNRATLAVARKLVAYLLAVDKRQRAFAPVQQMENKLA